MLAFYNYIETYHRLNSAENSAGIAGDSAGTVGCSATESAGDLAEGSAEPADSLDADLEASCPAGCCSAEAKHFLLNFIRNRYWSTDRQQH